MAMKKTITALAMFAFAMPALSGGLGLSAGGKTNAGVGVGAAGVGVGANANVNANANANADSRGPSASAIENSNGSFAADRDFGRDRALERMSAQGKAHEQATVTDKKRSLRERLRANAALSGRGDAQVNR
jgi:hypothetical protein